VTGKTVAITGATAGIGRATALRFDAAGYRVAAYGRNADALAELRGLLRPGAVVDSLNVEEPDEWVTRLAELTEHTGGQLDVLVNNAGILSAGRFAEIDLSAQRSIIDVNIGGTVNGCHAAYPYLRATPKAQVINVSSASALYGQPELATYSASKFAIRGLTEALDLEWADDDIRVCAVWPLFVDTDMVDGVDTGSTRTLGVSLTAEDVAESILKIAQGRPRLPHGPHFAVGRQAQAMMTIAPVVPTWLMRQITRLATRH
jgi:NAD(P)-dependent dehydrogenase (short-subunit alcohol dehydrogenase family)